MSHSHETSCPAQMMNSTRWTASRPTSRECLRSGRTRRTTGCR
ncbi:hypothetical protein E2C01_085467 [Portunus trituberculatus]|uniref:Uncharacterized protein n=1 Tax=Portunus trituberculatus TaxID=210409 RepID=A0A5B7JC04_PORTR|nr:hypothetical protein [Portunus trituberculatus]